MTAAITPIVGGHYRYKLINGDGSICIGVFVDFKADERCFVADLYVEALTPPNEVPPEYASLIGLPDVESHPLVPFDTLPIENLLILDRVYICKNSVYQKRFVQWRVGMRNLYRISDDEEDEHSLFNGLGNGELGSYINEEHDYLGFRIQLVKVRKSISLLCIH
jgi:hypothetical protein